MSNLGRTIRGFVFIAGQLDNNIKEEGVSSMTHPLLMLYSKVSQFTPENLQHTLAGGCRTL